MIIVFLFACGVNKGIDNVSEDSAQVDDSGSGQNSTPATDSDDGINPLSSGCGIDSTVQGGGLQMTMDFGPDAGGERGFYLVIPSDYDPDQGHRLIMGFSGRDWTGQPMRGYLNLEDGTPNEIFVYPDPKWREFQGWGTYGGWLLGEHAGPATGVEDFEFVRALISHLEDNYCINTAQIFATGQSWGGDMSHVLACFVGDKVRAAVPVAANTPYWFTQNSGGRVECVGETAVWTMFGQADDAFPNQPYQGAYGDECNAFWTEENNCGTDSIDLGLGESGECVEYSNCDVQTRYCLYDAQYGHQIPSGYYSVETMAFFRSLD
ncbi:MAG: alpha/beta hydrolase family esterase [Myxococcota bacterium]